MAGIGIDEIRIVSGQGNVLRFGGDDACDIHCARCRSLFYSVVRGGTFAHVRLGTLVDTASIRSTAHFFVVSKAEWFEITDDFPQHRRFGWPKAVIASELRGKHT